MYVIYIYADVRMCIYKYLYVYMLFMFVFISIIISVIYICAYIDETAGQPFSEAVLLGDIPHPGICSHALSKIWLACMHACM